jgi:hypothetical protein
MTATVIPLKRKEHPPAFTCGSLDFKYYATSHWQHTFSGKPEFVEFWLFFFFLGGKNSFC